MSVSLDRIPAKPKTRGVLAEFIVARAVGVETAGVREEWAAYDLQTPDGVMIENAWLEARTLSPSWRRL